MNSVNRRLVSRLGIVLVALFVVGSASSAGVALDGQPHAASDHAAEAEDPSASTVGVGNDTGDNGTGQADATTEREPNDNVSDANELMSGEVVSGEVSPGPPPDVDGFVVEADANGTIAVNFSRIGGTGVLAVGVFDTNASLVSLALATSNDSTRLVVPVNESGAHYVVAAPASWEVFGGFSGPSANGTGPYELGVTATVPDAASPVNATGNGSANATGNATANATANATGNTTATANATDDVTDANATPNATGGNATPNATPGNATPNDTDTGVAPTTPRESEPNDVFGHANPLESGDTVRGSLENESDVDLFRVDVAAGETLDAVVLRPQPAVGTATFGIFHPNGTLLVSDTNAYAADTVQLSVDANASGTYFVGIWSGGAATGPYLVSVSTTDQVGGTFDDGNESSVGATGEPAT